MMEKSGIVIFLLAATVVSSSPFRKGEGEAEKVLVGYYAESLCPDCIAFSTGPMKDAVEQVGTIFDLSYVPWGNARITSDGSFECQHGPMECTINTVEACLLHYYPERDDFWPFVLCMDEHGRSQDMDVGKQCAEKSSLEWSSIEACTEGDLGKKLENMYANVTASLNPPHTEVPWITINGKHNSNAQGNGLTMEICRAYESATKPPACFANERRQWL